MPSDHLRFVVADSIATIALDRPDAMNALDVDLKVALLEALQSAAEDDSIRVVIIGGVGRGFCVGQDLAEHAAALEAGDTSLSTVSEHFAPIIEAITSMPKPVVAAVNGPAAGAGAAIAFACDFRLMADDASFSMAFSRIGLAPDSGASWTLPHLVGPSRAMAMLLLGDKVDAEAALAMGLVNVVVPHDRLAAAVDELAERLAAGAPAAYAETKALVHAAATTTLGEALDAEAAAQARCGATEDHANAVAAFLAKETVTFTGR